MKLVEEMYARGYEFEPIDLFKVKAHAFQIVSDKKIMPCLSTIEGLGDLHFIRHTLALPHALHNLKRMPVLNSHLNQIGHNIIARADCSGKRTGSFLDQCLGIIKPHVMRLCYDGIPHRVF